MDAKATILSTLAAEEPPDDLSSPLKALWWLKKGELGTGAAWRRAHEICQSSQGVPEFDLVHALVHVIEGDTGNAAYWFRRAGVPPTGGGISAQWERIVAELDR
ncbi:MAG: hypothetical protein ACE5FS_13170 [Paracoccaceae bacterium]